jgi:hypothetical protein
MTSAQPISRLQWQEMPITDPELHFNCLLGAWMVLRLACIEWLQCLSAASTCTLFYSTCTGHCPAGQCNLRPIGRNTVFPRRCLFLSPVPSHVLVLLACLPSKLLLCRLVARSRKLPYAIFCVRSVIVVYDPVLVMMMILHQMRHGRQDAPYAP